MAKIGRPTDAIKHKFQMILEQSGAHLRFQEILRNTKDEKNFLKAYELANDRGYGKPDYHVEVGNLDGAPMLIDLSPRALGQVQGIIEKGSPE